MFDFDIYANSLWKIDEGGNYPYKGEPYRSYPLQIIIDTINSQIVGKHVVKGLDLSFDLYEHDSMGHNVHTSLWIKTDEKSFVVSVSIHSYDKRPSFSGVGFMQMDDLVPSDYITGSQIHQVIDLCNDVLTNDKISYDVVIDIATKEAEKQNLEIIK